MTDIPKHPDTDAPVEQVVKITCMGSIPHARAYRLGEDTLGLRNTPPPAITIGSTEDPGHAMKMAGVAASLINDLALSAISDKFAADTEPFSGAAVPEVAFTEPPSQLHVHYLTAAPDSDFKEQCAQILADKENPPSFETQAQRMLDAKAKHLLQLDALEAAFSTLIMGFVHNQADADDLAQAKIRFKEAKFWLLSAYGEK